MSREEEIQEAIKDIHKSIDCNGLACWQCIELSIGKGISWADQHPKEGLWDSEKVYNVLKNMNYKDCMFSIVSGPAVIEFDADMLIKKLRKAME